MTYNSVPFPPKEDLENLYNQPGQSMAKLGLHYNVSSPTVRKWLKYYGVELKDFKQVRQEANVLLYQEVKIADEPLALLNDYDWLYDQRIVQRKAYETIGKEIGVSEPTVKKWVKKHNIPMVRLNESEHSVKLLLENKEFLETEYAKNKSQKDIADEIGVDKSTVSVFFKKHGITTRPPNSYPKKGGRSLEEISLHDWITSVYDGEVIHSDKSVLANCFQLDLYIPDRNLAIEYNGLYTHTYKPDGNSVATIKGPEYHLGKTLGCLEKGINLVHVFSDQWKKNRSAVENLLLTKLGLNDKVPARKCIITTPTVHEKILF